jgi:hypothetical protein
MKNLKLSLLLIALAVTLTSASNTFGSVTITIQNNDSSNVGFNDPTPASPVGGNNGTTIGQQRLNAFRFAADIWGATLNSTRPIIVDATWVPLSCTPNSAVLGSAGNANIHSNFPGAPFSNTWYGTTLANALSGTDRNGASPDIRARFNVSIGTPGCFETSFWYYGFDGNEGNGIDLVAVLLHEFGHGLGFQSFTNDDGSQTNNIPGIFDRFLRDNTTGKLWSEMTNAERLASSTNTGNLVWNGPQVTADVPNVLGNPRLRVNSPPGIAGLYNIATAEFGPPVSSPGITNTVAQSSPVDGCAAIGSSVAGKIAFINRGTCNFTVKVKNAQNAGAVGVIIGNVSGSDNPNVAPPMGGTDPTITIPSVSLALNDANTFRAQLGSNINATIFIDHSVRPGADSSNRALMYAPAEFQEGSSVSHYDVSATPNLLMEPDINNDLNHAVAPPSDLTLSLLRDIGWTGVVAAPSIQLTASSFSVGEGGTSLSIGVTRSGDTSLAATVDYATSDNSGTNNCNLLTGQASAKCDYSITLGKLTFAPGQNTKTISIPVIDDSYAEGSETFTFTLSNATGASLGSPATATLTITDNESSNGVNPIDNASFFVRQHYLDFLNREPDPDGFAFWTNEINSCQGNAQCIETKRINVSAAFFLSIEFQQTGFFVERMYRVAYGDAVGNSTFPTPHTLPVPIIQLSEFLSDKQQIGDGIVVGQAGWEQLLEARKQQYASDFVSRARFMTAYPLSMSAAQFVDTLNVNAGNPLSTAERNQLVSELQGGTRTRAQVVRAVAEDTDLVNADKNRAFVLSQFFGYIRRNPNASPDSDHTGYDFWLQKLNQFNGNFVNAEMVKAFIISGEYRQRFGP